MDPRETAIGLVRYVTENAAKDFDGESIAAIIYRLRVVENYVSSDVDIICEAMRILIKKLVNLPPITFSPDVWMPIMTSITEGAIEPQWRIMMESIDISKFSSTSSNFVHMDSITASSTKCSEQITSICKGFALEFGLTRRLFSAIWNTDLEETARKMMNQEWDSVKIDSSPDSAKQAAGLIEKSIFDLFSEMKDHETFANELYYAALARILNNSRRLQENKKPAIQDSEDISFYESSLHIYDELIKKLWPHLSKKDPNVKKNTLIIFEKLISLSPTDVLVQRITEKFIDSCEWLKISGEEICTSMEPRLWKIVGSLVSRILDLKKTIPYEIVSDCGPDSFDSTCDQPSNMKERFLRHMVDSTRSSLLSIIQFLRTAKSSEEIVQFMRVFYPELVFGNETLITHAAIEMLRESASHHSIKADDFISIVLSVIDAPAIVRIIDVISCIKDEKVRKEAVEKTIIRMANDLEDEDQKREGYVNHLHENGSFWNDIAKYADASILDKAGKRFVEVSVDSMDIRSSVLATDIFLTILKLKLTSEAEREPESCVICNVSYSNIKIDLEKWNKMGNILVECNMVKRSKSEALPLFTIHQLENIDLPMRDLVYVVTQMKFLDTKEGMELHRKFYDGLPGVNVIFEKFMSKSHKIELCMKLLDEFAKIIAINEKSLIFSLDHENILDWLEEIGVLDSPQITEKLVDICFSIEVWDVLTLLQLDGPECHYWDLQMFGRFWKTSLMDLLDEKMMKKVNEKMGSILKEQYDKQSHVAKATREKRSNGKFPNRPKVADWEEQLLLMHNRIAGHLTKKKVEDFADESTQKFTWLLGVCSGQMSYKKEVAVDAEKILSRLYPDAEKRNEVLYHFGVSSILKGLDRPRGKLSLHILFMQIYLDLVQIDSKSWKIDDSVQKLSRRLGGFNEWLMIVDEEKREDDGGFRIYIVLNLSHYFWELLEGCKASQVVDAHAILKIRKFAEVLASILDKITFWPNPKLHAYYYIAQFLEPLETIFHFPEIAEQNRKVIESFFKQLFDKLLEQKYQEGLLQDTKLIIQKTDKYLSSSLNLFNEYNTQEPSKIYPVNEIFSLFCRYGSENVHLYCLKMIKKSLQTLASNILEHEHILKGEVCIETELQKRLVCDAVLLTEFFGYFSCIYAQVSENQPSEHDDVAKAFMLLDSDIHLKTKSRKRSTQNSVAVGSHRHQTAENMDLNFCTYKSTGRAYVTQHWYNCYTCNMMESEGVCSVCAINCHRGHDLAYSKKGSFFCDCGEKKCGAMQGIYHLPNSMYSLRGQLPEKNGDKTLPKIRNVFEHRFENLNSNCCDELKSALNDVQEEFKEVQDDLEQILEAVDFANQKALQVTEERLAVLESFNDMDDVIISEKEKFIEPLESGHFLPTRRDDLPVQELRVASSQHKIRELSDIIKLDDGTELLVLIPESIQTCLQLHYMDTRTNLIQGMHALRTETEQIPFNARSLHVSGNRLVVCGQYEFFALRFSPQGDVIDRAHIKLLENGASSSMNNNPVVRAKFCREIESDKRRRQLIAVATMQYIRIYDLTLHETNFVEEMVLPAGNVEDVEIINQEDGNVRILVLSSSGYLYEHNISVFNAENNSIFLTNVVNTPGMDMNGDGVSLHYSSTFNLLFVSLENGAFVAQLPEPTGNSTAPIYDWKHLNIKNPVDAWKETSGIIACLSTNCNHQVNYFHPTVGKILLQKTSVKRSIMTYFLMTSAKNQSVYSVLIYPNVPTCEIWETSWNNVHDLWIDDVPTERYAVEVVEQKSTQIPIDRDELVLLAEQCEQIRTVDWNCREIGMFYTHEELNNRLSSSDSLPITLIQQTHFKLSARITNFRQIVRMIRVEVEGNTGPEYLKIGTTRYSISSRGPKTFDLRLSREESLALDHRDITIEVIPRSNQNRVTLKSLRLLGCDRSAMDEIQPRYERQPILTNSNKLVYSILEFATLSGLEWAGNMAKKHLSRKLNHPAVCSVSTRAIVKCHPSVDEELFKIIDGAYLQEWKALIDWTESEGFGEMRLHHVEQLLDRMEAVRTRWPYFVKSLKREFGTVTSFVELMRNEMKRMPLHRCQMMAQAIVKIVFGLLSNGTNEAEQLIHVFLNIFTDQDTYHLANDMRSAVQETISRFENALKEEKKLMVEHENMDKESVLRIKNYGFSPFYGAPRIIAKTPESMLIAKIAETIPIDSEENFKWLEQLISMILEKLTRSNSTVTWQNLSDSPSYNLSRVLASCLAICDPVIIRNHFSRLIHIIKYDVEKIFPMSEKSYSNYSLLRSVELLLFVCLEKRGDESKENQEMLDSIVHDLQAVGIRNLCLKILEKVIPHWKDRGPSTFSRNSAESRKVWLPHVPLVSSSANPPNTSIMNWPSTSEDSYIIACTDLILLIPQHLQELDRRKSVPRDDQWIQKLCQLASLSSGCSAYRQCKKLLLAMCHNDENKYKIMRDKYKMQDLLQQLVKKYLDVSKEVGGHQQLTEIVDVLASITKLALIRPDMWRDVCSTHTTWLLRLACYTTDVVASQVVELLIVAVRDSSVGGQLSIQLADSIVEAENGEFIEKIIKRFLIGRDEQLRWTLHGMLRSVIQLASRQNQCILVKKLYNTIYPLAANLGVQGAQLVDLIATYAPRVFSSTELVAMTQSEISTIEKIRNTLNGDGYQGMYKLMSDLGLGWKSINFDRNPCLVCFTSKGSHDVVKMTSIKSDIRYSANTIIYKLISNYEVSKVTIKLTELKKSKSIKKVSLYYSAKSVESVDLKLHPELWRKCAMVTVAENETVINLSLAVPVVTSSLIVEFEEVVDHRGSSQLHCPRCTVPVRTHSGVCESCGENAFQCAKCRAINYVEKEPFLCQSCGFCKYAQISLFVVCRALPGAQHITCDAERGQCVQEITQLLIKMETTKTKLTGYRAACESLYLRNRPLPPYKLHVENNHTSEFFDANGTMNIEQLPFQSITMPMNNLAVAIRTLHSELCQQTQQLMYLHEELNRYDHASEVSVVFHKPQNISYYSTGQSCFGCLCNQLLHSVALLHSSCDDENALNLILSSDSLIEKLGVLAQTYETLREEVEELLVRLMFDRLDVTTKVEKLIHTGDINLSVMVKSLMYAADPTWQQKLKLLIRLAMDKRDENCCLQALMVLSKYLEATKSVTLDERKKIKLTPNKNITKWLTTDEEWKDCFSVASTSTAPTKSLPSNPYQWITDCLFSQWMSVRSAANQLLVNLSRQQFHEPVALLILCENMSKLSDVPSSVCDQFMCSAHTIIDSSVNTKARLFVQQFHVYLIKRIHEECAKLHEQSVNLLSDNMFGERLRCFVELLSLLLSGSNVENVLLKAGADDLLIFLLHSTIFLKRIMTRRTRATDSSRIALEKLLKRVSCRDGTKLMSVCVESLKLVKDTSTLGIIVGVMMEIMDPQQETEESFLIQIEKDIAQEDFLQGRMTHNPYNSSDPGMGPLMRDIKNKICRDTEMIALMEDDNGMELLVNGNIISLSLSVRDVYDRLWKRSNNGSPMLIVYRMRGLMGDAVETFIENFGVADNSEADDEEDEQLVRMTHCLMECGGIDKLMDLLTTNVDSSSGRFLLCYLRKIFERIVKIPIGRKILVQRRMVERMMSVIRTCCADPTNESKVLIGMELYKVVEFVVSDKHVQDILGGIREDDAMWWFDLFEKRGNEEGSVTELHRKTAQILDQMTMSIGNIVLGNDASEGVLVKMYEKVLKWEQIDSGAPPSGATDHQNRSRITKKDQIMLMTEQLATITSNIISSAHGIRLKQKILDSGVISSTCNYLTKDLPNLYQPTESPEWKVFLARPSLKLILTLLAGLARGHQASQKEIAKTTLKLMHRLEQVASDNSIGTLAENVIEALNEDEEVRNQIKLVRDETEKKKKQMAMLNREKQLTKMRMKVGTGGQIKVSSRTLHNEPSIDDSDSLPCCICRESVISGDKSAGVYAFAAIDPDSGKTSTVSMMVMVHFNCHKDAIRGGGGRAADEWTRSKLHNAGAKCNVITPISMGVVIGDAWIDALHRFENDVGRVSGLAHGVVNRNFVFVDICNLIDRFIYKRSFSNQSEGGGRESNMQYLAILHLLGITLPADAELEISAPNHRLIAFLFTELTADSWNDQRNDVLRAGINDAQTNGAPATWDGFKPTLMTWAFVDAYFNKVIKITGEDRLEWLREHLVETINKTRGFVDDFDSNILPCEDVAEFCDVTGAPIDDVNLFLAGGPPQ